jgi:hypothetical protein
MFNAEWITIADDSDWVAGEYSSSEKTEVMQVPGGIVLKTSHAGYLKNGKPATSSCALVFVPHVSVQVIEGKVMFDSTSADAAAHMGEAMGKALNKQLDKRGL